MKTHMLIILLAGMLGLAGCHDAPRQYEGIWYYDRDELSSRPRYIEFKNSGKLRDYDGDTETAGTWRMDGNKMLVTLPDISAESPAERSGDTLTLTLPPKGDKFEFRHGDSIRFVKPLVGIWSNPNAELTVHEGGWALLRYQSQLSHIRLAQEGAHIRWSIRFFDARLGGTITVRSGNEIEFRWPNGTTEVLQKQK